MKDISRIILIALLLAVSCNKDPNTRGIVATGQGVTISFSTSATQTKAVTPGDGVVADGGGIAIDEVSSVSTPDLSILLFDSTGNLVAYYPDNGNHPETAVSAVIDYGEDESSAIRMTVTFTKNASNEDFDDGTYSVYALANTQGMWGMTDGTHTYANWTSVMSALVEETLTEAGFKTLKFSGLSEGVAPTVQNGRIPLSAIGAVSVLNGNGQVSAEMLRVVSKVGITIENATGDDLKITGLRLVDFNPDRGYLLPQDDNAVPSDVNYSALTLIDPSDTDDEVTVEVDETTAIITNRYLFPGIATKGHYNLEITFGDYVQNVYTLGSSEITLADTSASDKEYYIYYYNNNIRWCGFAYLDPYFLSDTKMGVLPAENDVALNPDPEQKDNPNYPVVPQGAEFRWKFEPKSDGTTSRCSYKIKNVGTGDYITTAGSSDTKSEVSYGNPKTILEGHYAYYVTTASSTDYVWSMSTDRGSAIMHEKVGDMEDPESSYFGITLSRGLTVKGVNQETKAYVHTANNAHASLKVFEAESNPIPFVSTVPIRTKANVDIGALDRNQKLDIFVGVSGGTKIPFEVELWTLKTENVHFD